MKPSIRSGRRKQKICPKCKKKFESLKNTLCSNCSPVYLGPGKTIPEPPDIGTTDCPAFKFEVELKICAMRRRTAIKYLTTGKPYQCWQCAQCPEGKRAVLLLKDYYMMLKEAGHLK